MFYRTLRYCALIEPPFIKGVLDSLKKIEGVSSSKRIIVKRSKNKSDILLRTELFHRNDDPSKMLQTLLKRGITHLPDVAFQNPIKPKKKKLLSLSKLLFEWPGANWVADPELTTNFCK